MSKHKGHGKKRHKHTGHGHHESNHFKKNASSLKTHGDGYGSPEDFTPMHEFGQKMKNGGMCHGGEM